MIRPALESDLDGAAALVRLLDSAAIISAESLRHRRPDAFVAEHDGELVAWAPSAPGWLFVGVHPEHRRRGLGGELLARIRERRRGERAVCVALDEAGAGFLGRRGFDRVGTLRTAVLDLRAATLPALPATAYGIVPLGELRGRAEELYALYTAVLADVPNAGGFLEQSFDEWRSRTLDNPHLDDKLSMVVTDGGRPVAFAWLLSDRAAGRAAADFAGTAPGQRGRGLATLAKLASTRAAAAAGIATITTENDLDNAPMLRINERLGFRPGAELVELVGEL